MTATSELPQTLVAEEVLVNQQGSTRRMPVEAFVAQMAAGAGPVHATRAQLYADLAWPAGTVGYVQLDSTIAWRGTYKKSGASGTGGWTRIGDLPVSPIDQAMLDQAMGKLAPEHSGAAGFFPLIGGVNPAGEEVALLWLQDGEIKGVGLDVTSAPVSSDGRSLWLLRAALARIQQGVAGARCRILLAGDSWNQLPYLSRSLRTMLQPEFGDGGYGWRDIWGGNNLDTSSLTKSAGWTVIDGHVLGPYSHRLGLDGMTAHTSAAGETISWISTVATEIRIYHRRAGGAWRWRVDGGLWTTVTTPETDQALGIVAVSGLADAAHTVEIETVSGTTVINGLWSTRAAGLQIVKCGNGGLAGRAWLDWMGQIGPIVGNIQPDAAVVCLGTNDYRMAESPPSVYIAALREYVAQVRAARTGCGFVFVLPPQSDGVAAVALRDYRDALVLMCQQDGHEYIDALTSWPGYAAANTEGLWADPLHLSEAGYAALARQVARTIKGA